MNNEKANNIHTFKNITIKVNSIFLDEGKSLAEKMEKLIEQQVKKDVA